MNNYLPIIKQINQSLNDFNTYLKDGFAVPLLNEIELENQNYYMDLTTFNWEKEKEWINSGKRGVYFIFGVDMEPPFNLGLYIGKASMTSYFGNRFHSHLYPSKKEKLHIMRKIFSMELITTIPIEKKNVFLAPALEEFLINEMKNKVRLLNKTGK